MRRPALALAAVAAVLSLTATACSGDPSSDPPTDGAGQQVRPVKLTYGVFGSTEEIASYQAVVDAYNAQATSVSVQLASWPTSAAMMADIAGPDGSAEAAPDIYLLSRDDLPEATADNLNVALFDLLEARNVSYGDTFPRPALSAFSRESDLQCMPYSVSPMVTYLNTDLVDFDAMRARGLEAPEPDLEEWSLDEFREAGRFATSQRRDTRGISIEPHLSSLAPYLYSGGGGLYDDESDPRSLDLSSDANRSTLAEVLDIARNPATTLTDEQLAEASPTEWFERGKLGMLAGFRSLTPELRSVPGLQFDVMPMPRVDGGATVGDLTGLCIAPGKHVQRAADFMVYVLSTEGYAPVAEAGYVVPANLEVARSDAFLQPDQQPGNAAAFNAGVDELVLPPVVPDEKELDTVVDPLLADVFTIPLIPNLGDVTTAIDLASRAVLDPDFDPTQSESPDSSGSS